MPRSFSTLIKIASGGRDYEAAPAGSARQQDKQSIVAHLKASFQRGNSLCRCSKIMSPPNSNVKMSPHERKDIRCRARSCTGTSERNFQLC